MGVGSRIRCTGCPCLLVSDIETTALPLCHSEGIMVTFPALPHARCRAVVLARGRRAQADCYGFGGPLGGPCRARIYAYRDEGDREPFVLRSAGSDGGGACAHASRCGCDGCIDVTGFAVKFGVSQEGAAAVLAEIGAALEVAAERFNRVHYRM